MRKYLILLLGVTITSCAVNKSIVLFPIEPFEIYENDILFSIPEKQNLWITFQAPLVENSPGAYFRANIRTNQNIESVYLKSISLNVTEIDLFYNKNIMLSIPNVASKLSNPDYLYHASISGELFTTDELLSEYSKNISFDIIFSKFNRVKEAEYSLIITYILNDQYYETELKWKYNISKKTSLARWDAIMGI
jgi:hypothetical protein